MNLRSSNSSNDVDIFSQDKRDLPPTVYLSITVLSLKTYHLDKVQIPAICRLLAFGLSKIGLHMQVVLALVIRKHIQNESSRPLNVERYSSLNL
ncbi:MAG: hypothetical protein CL912_30630 [Deltaproteobacteria bacterium]|nr:hypothetical protein [Deltaproteobacteria bacterium]